MYDKKCLDCGKESLVVLLLNEQEYTKTAVFNGEKAIESCQKERNRCEFTYFAGDRYLVQLKGENVSIEKLKQVAGGLGIK